METVQCVDCGRAYDVQIYGHIKDRKDRVKNWKGRCSACWRKQRLAESKQWGLPKLKGSEKQVVWAESIRLTLLNKVQQCLNEAHQDDRYTLRQNDIMTMLCEKQPASWWIDMRSVSGIYLLETIYKSLGPLQSEDEKTLQKEVEAQATVSPESPYTKTVAEIRPKVDEIEIHFPEKREDFRKVVKFKLHFGWEKQEAVWKRQTDSFSGHIEDRVSEAGHRLLAAGFRIRIFEAALRERAISGDFKPEIRKWIKARVSKKGKAQFVVWWGREHDYYRLAKRIAAAKWVKRCGIVVPSEHFEEVLDFANMYDFNFSEEAEKLIEKAKIDERNELIVTITPKEESPVASFTTTPRLGVPQNVTADDEFIEAI